MVTWAETSHTSQNWWRVANLLCLSILSTSGADASVEMPKLRTYNIKQLIAFLNLHDEHTFYCTCKLKEWVMINQLTLRKQTCSSEKAAMTFQVSKTVNIILQIHELSRRQRILTCDLLAELIWTKCLSVVCVCVCVCARKWGYLRSIQICFQRT